MGERLKKLRMNCHMSVRNLAASVGVTPSFIYQIEQGKVSPSFSTLKGIAGALNTSVALLAGDDLPEEWEVVRKDRRRHIVTGDPGVRVELLNFLGPRNKKMQPVALRLEPGATQQGFIYSHDREDLVYVQEGTIEVSFGRKAYTLNEGDVAYFMFEHPAVVRNPGDRTAVALWIVCPPGA
ncbi:MAG: helix-turn-helix transcriptional regulator [Firmicutes bacterium]|nr:helix-turn-helix transcriptional regulator [Bacillota bacterium]